MKKKLAFNPITGFFDLVTKQLNANEVGTGVVDNTEFSYLDGVNAPIQTQLNNKVPTTRNVTAGAGLVGGGPLSTDISIDVVAHSDGSILVNPDNIQVGILATDTQHGVRGGGNLHSVATTSVAGFMSAADKLKLDGIAAGATAYTDEEAQDAVGNILTTSSTISFTYNDGAPSISADIVALSINNTHISNSAGIVYSKLNLVNSIVNADIASAAAISLSKLAALTINRALVSDASGVISVSATTSTEIGYVSGVTSSIQTQLNGKQPLDATLTALAAYNTNGILTQTAADTFVGRTIVGTVNNISVVNGDGVAGNPTIDLVNAGTAGTYGSASQVPVITTDAKGRVTSVTPASILITSTAITDFVEASQDAVAAAFINTTTISLVYNDGLNQISANINGSSITNNEISGSAAIALNKLAALTANRALISDGSGFIVVSTVTATELSNLSGSSSNIQTQLNGKANLAGGNSFTGTQNIAATLSTDNAIAATQGRVLIGSNTAQDITGGSIFPVFQILGTSATQMVTAQYSADANPPALNLLKSRGALNAQGLISNNDEIGRIQFRGSDGVNFQASASIRVFADGTPSAGSMPGRISFLTTPTGSTNSIERLHIDSTGQSIFSGNLRIGNGTDTTNGNFRFNGTEFQVRQAGVWRVVPLVPTVITSGTGSLTTTSATYSTITGLTTTPAAGTYLVFFSVQANINANANGDVAIHLAGNQQVETTANIGTTDTFGTSTVSSRLSGFTTLTVNGSQVVDVRFRENGGGTLTVTSKIFILIPIAR